MQRDRSTILSILQLGGKYILWLGIEAGSQVGDNPGRWITVDSYE
jgi:hypothetical protein